MKSVFQPLLAEVQPMLPGLRERASATGSRLYAVGFYSAGGLQNSASLILIWYNDLTFKSHSSHLPKRSHRKLSVTGQC